MNQRAVEIFGPELKTMGLSGFYVFKEDSARLRRRLRCNGRLDHFEVQLKKGDGSVFPAVISSSLIQDQDNNALGRVSFISDFTERKELERRLVQLSYHDGLTNVYNRTFFEQEKERLNDGRNMPIGIVLCDIDGLKLVNDINGHKKGDELVKIAAEILKKCFRKSDILARIGGDEFAVLLTRCTEDSIYKCIKRINNKIETYNRERSGLALSISVGYAIGYDTSTDLDALFKKADDHMYKQKIAQKFSFHNDTIRNLIKVVEDLDNITPEYVRNFYHQARGLGRALNLSEDALQNLKLLVRFHDLGKAGIPRKIWTKPGPLTQEEFDQIKAHCELGHRIAMSISHLAPIAHLITQAPRALGWSGLSLGAAWQRDPP